MNRAFVIVFVPAAMVATGYLVVLARLGVPLRPLPMLGAVAVFAVAAGIVYLYRKRHARPRSDQAVALGGGSSRGGANHPTR